MTTTTTATMSHKHFSLPHRSTRTVFYCTVAHPARTMKMNSSLAMIDESRTVNDRRTNTSPLDPTETCSSTCSSTATSTSSSGYFSATTARHRCRSFYPLKSCLKRTTATHLVSARTRANVLVSSLAGDILTLTRRHVSEHVRARTLDSRQCTRSEQDLRTKKSVSFCNDIARRWITPYASPQQTRSKSYRGRHQTTNEIERVRTCRTHVSMFYFADDCDFVPQESFIDSPPNEFRFSYDDNDDTYEPMNFIASSTATDDDNNNNDRHVPMKTDTSRDLIDAFSQTILRILEIKCNDPTVNTLSIDHQRHRYCFSLHI
jgi:hypothetical protein